MKKGIVLIGLGVAAFYLFRKLKLSQSVNILFRNLKVGGSLLKPELKLELAIQNATLVPVTFKSFTGNVYVNGEYLSNFSSFGDQKIAANSESMITITARPGILSAAKNIIAFLKNPKQKFIAELKGSANINNIPVPVNEIVKI